MTLGVRATTEAESTTIRRSGWGNAGRYLVRNKEGRTVRIMSTRKAYTYAAKHGFTVEDTAITHATGYKKS